MAPLAEKVPNPSVKPTDIHAKIFQLFLAGNKHLMITQLKQLSKNQTSIYRVRTNAMA